MKASPVMSLRLPAILALVAVLLALPVPAQAFESDVHFGLTRWLALRAGFTPSQADSIAVANQRIDGGLIENLAFSLEYACAGSFPEVARQVQDHHYPSAKPVPAAPVDRMVVPGGEAARRALAALAPQLKGKEGLLLGKFGEALHPLQDSWAHQGKPSQPGLGASLGCDAALASSPPLARGGSQSHSANLSAAWPADVIGMAQATYEALRQYPAIQAQDRQPADWALLLPALRAFAKASTKTQKRAWFVGQGITDTGFLGGISLPDGADPGLLTWGGQRLPPLAGSKSLQHDAPAEVRAFFDDLLARWLSNERVESVLADMGPARAKPVASDGVRSARELAARLKLWKLRDHGNAAKLAHAPAPLSDVQLQAVDRLVLGAAAMLPPMALAEAVYPLQPAGPAPMPLLPYIVRPLPDWAGLPRMMAIARLKHAPYDTVGWIAARIGERWVLVDLVASVDL